MHGDEKTAAKWTEPECMVVAVEADSQSKSPTMLGECPSGWQEVAMNEVTTEGELPTRRLENCCGFFQETGPATTPQSTARDHCLSTFSFAHAHRSFACRTGRVPRFRPLPAATGSLAHWPTGSAPPP